MTENYIIYQKGILNQFPLLSASHVTTGGITVATAIVIAGGAFKAKSGPSGSVYAAYKDLWERLNNGQIGLTPSLTATEIGTLSDIDDGVQIINKTTGREEICINGNFQNPAGTGLMAKAAYGSMYQHNHAGDAMNATTKQWITASVGKLDSNGLITFGNDAVNGDYLLVGTGGAGDYQIIVTCDVTNAANNETVMEVHINGADATDLEDKEDSSSTKPRGMAAHGIHALADADKITLHLESTTPADVVKTYDCHVTIQRVS